MSKIKRPVIVAVMGHVDHGKTSLLDRIRNTQIQSKEHGGITQSIGAYQVEHQGEKITFIDTPGHQAFAQMRARGGQVADIAILVVAADDGVQPQTIEALNHANASHCKVIVALNKVDLPTADLAKAKRQLSDLGLAPKDYGGTTEYVETSATTGKGIDDLLQRIIDESSTLDLQIEADARAEGVIIESQLDSKRGPVVSGIVTQGTLRTRDILIAGDLVARVRALKDWRREDVDEAGPSMPVEILGFEKVPDVGIRFELSTSRKDAEKATKSFSIEKNKPKQITPEERIKKLLMAGKFRELALIVKADTQGSLEAVLESIRGMETDNVKINTLHTGIGKITESDVFLAMPVRGFVIGFNVDVEKSAQELARREKVVCRTYQVIYHLLEELQEVVAGETDAITEKIYAEARVKKMFVLSNGLHVAGSDVITGTIKKGQKVKVMRGGEVFTEARVSSLHIGKDMVSQVNTGTECGIILTPDVLVQEGDLIQAISK
jgi:translation initiation factor IF-2